MGIRAASCCVVLSGALGLFFPARTVAVPPPDARTANGALMSRDRGSRATRPLPRASSTRSESAGFDALGVTLLSHIPYAAFGGNSFESEDCWGYVSPSGREYAIISNSHGIGLESAEYLS